MSPPPASRLKHIPVRLRVTFDPARWTELYDTPAEDIPDAIRRLVVSLVQESAAAQRLAIVSVRRDGDR